VAGGYYSAMRGWDREDRQMWRMNRTPIGSIIAGAAFTAVFGALFLIRGGEYWWLFPAMFAGVLPMIGGVLRLFRTRKSGRDAHTEREADVEKQVLRAAQEQGGKLTAALTALRTSLTIKEAQSLLERMAKEGHAVMNVTREGTLEFEFPDFFPRADRPARIE
jgi:ABC-type Fe3+-siderophore transport system permease subunit